MENEVVRKWEDEGRVVQNEDLLLRENIMKIDRLTGQAHTQMLT